MTATAAGVVEAIDAEAVGLAAMALGAGRARVEDRVDPAVGIVLCAKVGDRVEAGRAALPGPPERRAAGPAGGWSSGSGAAYRVGPGPVAPPPLVLERMAEPMKQPPTLATRLAYAAAWVRGKTDLRRPCGLILGSGLGGFADRLERARRRSPTPRSPASRSPASRATPAGWWWASSPSPDGPVRSCAMQGRVHGYEGWPRRRGGLRRPRALRPRRAGRCWSPTPPAASHPASGPGDLVRITDHLNLTGQNPLTGQNDDALGPRFPDMSEAYDPRARRAARRGGRGRGRACRCSRGVYAGLAGPSYETPAEIRMLRDAGGRPGRDVDRPRGDRRPPPGRAGGRALGGDQPGRRASAEARLTHEEVQARAERARPRLEALLAAFVRRAVR